MTPSTPQIVAIIPHYYREREASLWAAVNRLQQQILPPVSIVIWDNSGRLSEVPTEFTALTLPTVSLLRSPRNLGPGARFGVAGSCGRAATHVFFQDNDVWLPRTALAELYYWAEHTPQSVVSLEGRRRIPTRPYQQWPKEYGCHMAGADPIRVQLVLGRADLVPMDTLRKILPEIPNPCPEMDDMAFSAACGRLGIGCWVVPGPPLKNFEAGVGLCHEPDFYQRRDAAAKALVWEVPRVV